MKQSKAKENINTFETHEFIPFACHYTSDTILTKNGELIQTIAITSSGSLKDDELRERIRKSINNNVDPSKFAVWVHCVRKRTSTKISDSGKNNFDYTSYVNGLWDSKLPKQLMYKNTIYISLVRDATRINYTLPKNYLRSLFNSAESNYRNRIFSTNHQELSNLSDLLLAELSEFGAHKLELYEDNGNFYSSVMECYNEILTLKKKNFELSLTDLSRDLVPSGITFNSYNGQINFFETSQRKFGAIITLKEHLNVHAFTLRDILNIDSEFVISECYDFASGNTRSPHYLRQRDALKVSNDKDLEKLIQIDPFADENKNNYVLEQSSITIIKDTPQELNKTLNMIYEELNSLGIIYITEDIRAERAYWSTLPGNFAFLRRQTLTTRPHIATFACLGDDKFKAEENCFFGEPLMFFEDKEDAPFPLHLYKEGQGNILIVSTDSNERTAMSHLICTQAAKQGCQFIYYDASTSNLEFAKKINSSYTDTLDFEWIRSSLTGEKTIVVLSSISDILKNHGHEFLANFVDQLNGLNAVVVCTVTYEDNCEAILPNFRTQIFFSANASSYADHFDIFEDEIEIISYLGDDNIYLKSGYQELILKFNPDKKLVDSLIAGDKR